MKRNDVENEREENKERGAFMYKKIEKVINEWNPIGLLPHAPEDEYSSEIKRIMKVLEQQPDISEQELDKAINTIFNTAFGISNSQAEKKLIARQIIQSLP